MNRWANIAILLSFITILNAGKSRKLLYLSNYDVELYDVLWRNSSTLVKHVPKIFEIDYDYEMQTIFYVVDRKSIYSMNLITKEVKVILPYSAVDIQNIAIDWITKNIYFTEEVNKRIEVFKFDGSSRHVLFKHGIDLPRGISVSPKHGFIFFSDCGKDARIEKANMDGSKREVFVSTYINMPTVIAVDPEVNVVYWIDLFHSTVEMIYMNKTGRRVIVEAGPYYRIAVLNSRLYFSDFKQIFSCDKVNGSLSLCHADLVQGNNVAAVKVFGRSFQPYLNSACHIKNGGCSHLCLLNPTGYSCACPTGFKLTADNLTCASSIEKFILLASRADIRMFSLDTKRRISVMLPLKRFKSAMAVDFDPVDRMLYWTDAARDGYGIVKQANLNGSVIKSVVPTGYTAPDHVVIDWIARNLYWTCPRFNKIYVSRLNGSSSTVIIDSGLEHPRGLAVDPGDGRLYWSDWGEHAKIEASDLDGANRVLLVNDSLQWPNGIALDFQRRHLYWVDGGTDKIEFYDLVHKSRHVLEARSRHMFGISVLGDFIYWTDWLHRSLYEFNLVTRKKSVIATDVSDIMGVKAIDTTLVYGSNDCQNNNNGCSHFCFHKPYIGAVCACPDGYKLDYYKKKCNTVTDYLLYSTRTYINTFLLQNNDFSAVPKIFDAEITHLATYHKYERVFWVENTRDGHTTNAIKSATLNDANKVLIVQSGFHGSVGGMAVDWISENIYWSQKHISRIEVSKLNGLYRRTLLQTRKGIRISLISVNPRIRKLYWFQSHKIKTFVQSYLHESNLDGSSQRILTNITGEPNGLAIDIPDNRIYWVSKNKNSIESINMNGSNQIIVAEKLGTPVGLTIYNDQLYFCEQETENGDSSSISSVEKVNGSTVVTKRNIGNTWCSDIAGFLSFQPGENICDRRNGGCEHLCFATSLFNRTCMCEMHYELDTKDHTSCIGPTTFIVLSEEFVIYRIMTEDVPEVPFHFNSPITATNLEYNLRTKTLYWIDTHTKMINYGLNGNIKMLNLGRKDIKVRSFVIDFFTNCLYWIEEWKNTISYINLDDLNKKGQIFAKDKYYPYKLAIFPEKGFLFFVNEHDSNSVYGTDSIERICLDGLEHKNIHRFTANRKTKNRYDIAIDYSTQRLYWLHKEEKKVESVNLEGSDKQIQLAMSKLFTPIAIAVHDKYLYWIDREIKTRDEKLKRSPLLRKEVIHFQRIYENTNDLLIVNLNRAKKSHPCKKNNGGCSHICFGTSTYGNAVCGCPSGYIFEIGSNRTKCGVWNAEVCPFVCDGECKHVSLRCDGIKHCHDGLDEGDCAGNVTTNIITIPPVTTSPAIINAHPINDYSKYTAGIISGAILTVLLLICALYIVCRVHPKKVIKKEGDAFLQKAYCKFKSGTESVFVLPANNHLLSDEMRSESVSRMTRRDSCDYRYITGSSANMTDSIMLPFNPPPSVMSARTKLSSESSTEKEEEFDSCSYYEENDIPAPPATPLYLPSDNESIMAYQTDDTERSYFSKERNKLSCIYCDYSHNNDVCQCNNRVPYNSAAPSLASSSLATKNRLSYSKKPSRYNSLDSIHRHYVTDVSIDNRGRRLMPSLASESSCSSEVSIATVRELKDNNYLSDKNCYNTYAPPPSPGTEYADLNDFKQYEDDEPFEVDDFLLDSHRHDASSASSASELF